jgi:hypothetical protein
VSQYVTKRAQDAAERLDAVFTQIKEQRKENAGRMESKDFIEIGRMYRDARRELSESIRTEQIVASGDAVDVSSLLDGAL